MCVRVCVRGKEREGGETRLRESQKTLNHTHAYTPQVGRLRIEGHQNLPRVLSVSLARAPPLLKLRVPNVEKRGINNSKTEPKVLGGDSPARAYFLLW